MASNDLGFSASDVESIVLALVRGAHPETVSREEIQAAFEQVADEMLEMKIHAGIWENVKRGNLAIHPGRLGSEFRVWSK